MSYEQKYLKYKNKYLDLQKLHRQTGGYCFTNECEVVRNKLLAAKFSTNDIDEYDSKSINDAQIKNMIDLKNTGLFKDSEALSGGYELTGDINSGQIKKMIDLIKGGIIHYDTGLKLIKKLTDEQLEFIHDFSKKKGGYDLIALRVSNLYNHQLQVFFYIIKYIDTNQDIDDIFHDYYKVCEIAYKLTEAEAEEIRNYKQAEAIVRGIKLEQAAKLKRDRIMFGE
jgi:hypothetical protein